MIPKQNTPEWLEWRRGTIGASDLPSLFGEGYRSEYELALEKRGMSEPDEQSWPMTWGHRVQRLGIEAYHDLTDKRVRNVNTTQVSTRWPHCSASLDGKVVREPRGVEIKWTSRRLDEPPRRWQLQALGQMAVCDLEAVDILKLSGYEAPRIWAVERDEALITDLMDTAEAWYVRYVLGDELPPIDGSAGASRALDRLSGPEELQADAEQAEMVRQLTDLRARMKADSDTERLIVNRLKDSMAGAEALVGDRFRISWRRSKPRRSTDWHAVATHYRSMVQAPPETLDEIEQRHTEEKEGSRPFRLTTEEET